MKLRDILILVAVAVLAVVVTDRCYSSRLSEWEERAESALAVAEQQKARVAALESEADSLRSQAAAIAEDAAARAPVTDTLIEELPPAETPGEEARDEVIERLVVERDGFKAAYDAQLRASAKLREALDVAVERGDSLAAVLEDRPSKRPWYIPRLGIGPGVGYNGSGPHVDPLQIHLTWEIKVGG